MEETAQELTENVNQLQRYLDEHTPQLISFGIKVVLSIVVLYIGSRLIRWLLSVVRKSLNKTGMDKGAVQFLCSFLKALLYILLIFGIGMNFGIKESSVAALLGTAGVTIGLALQGGLSNLAGGVMLLIFKPFQVGDYIIVDKANGWEGTVYKIEICYTTLLSVDYRHIVIPNGTLSGNTVINLTARDMRKLELKVGISYDSDMHKAKQILEQILKEDKGTREDQDMLVYVDELAESGVILGFRVWVPTEDYWTVRWRLNEKIKDEFDRQGIVIPYQQLDVHLIS
nr:mechanosensitive ion channel domain-containing protein [uncultured Blautia sp.]